MPAAKKPPKAYDRFVRRYPQLNDAWRLASAAGTHGPLDERMRLVVKVALAMGAQREGAAHSAVRKALAAGVDVATLEQVVALGATTLGFPASVAAFNWVHDEVGEKRVRGGR